MASPTLGRLYPPESLDTHLLEADWIPGPVWARRSEEKSPPIRHPEINPGLPARSQAPCRLSYVYLLCLLNPIVFYD